MQDAKELLEVPQHHLDKEIMVVKGTWDQQQAQAAAAALAAQDQMELAEQTVDLEEQEYLHQFQDRLLFMQQAAEAEDMLVAEQQEELEQVVAAGSKLE